MSKNSVHGEHIPLTEEEQNKVKIALQAHHIQGSIDGNGQFFDLEGFLKQCNPFTQTWEIGITSNRFFWNLVSLPFLIFTIWIVGGAFYEVFIVKGSNGISMLDSLIVACVLVWTALFCAHIPELVYFLIRKPIVRMGIDGISNYGEWYGWEDIDHLSYTTPDGLKLNIHLKKALPVEIRLHRYGKRGTKGLLAAVAYKRMNDLVHERTGE